MLENRIPQEYASFRAKSKESLSLNGAYNGDENTKEKKIEREKQWIYREIYW